MIKFHCDTAETISDISIMKHTVKIAFQRSKRRYDLLFRPVFFNFLLKLFLFFLKCTIIFIRLAYKLKHIVKTEFRIRLYCFCIRKISDKFICLT